MTLLEEEDFTIEDATVEENQQLLIEGNCWKYKTTKFSENLFAFSHIFPFIINNKLKYQYFIEKLTCSKKQGLNLAWRDVSTCENQGKRW